MQQYTPRERGNPSLAAAFVKRKIHRLTGSGNEAAVRASLARLRRGIGKEPGSLPDLWEETLSGMPEPLAGAGAQPSYGEWAIHIALTLFALHQQGKDLKRKTMHQDGQRLGMAVRRLIQSPDEETRVKRRFDLVVTADSPEEISHHLRGVVQLLKASDIPLDYAALTRDLYLMQFPEARDGVRLGWGRDFYAGTFAKNTETEESTEGESENNEK